MPVFRLCNELVFPPVHLASDNGIIAVGGDLSPQRLLEAYRSGIFPWYSEDDPIIWWSPDPRFVLFPDELKVSRSMRQILRRKHFSITLDNDFGSVIDCCSRSRSEQEGTWITGEMRDAYCRLHDMGYAHSVETWQNNQLVGGLYGVSLGKCFFGESMFFTEANASKAALITLVEVLKNNGFLLIDCQVHTSHLESMGARHIPRTAFLDVLRSGLKHETVKGNWGKVLYRSCSNEQVGSGKGKCLR